MKWRCVFLLILVCVLTSCSAIVRSEQKYSPKDDQYWSLLVEEAESTKVSILTVLKNKNTHLYNQILKDSQDSQLLSFWGQSLNFDAFAKAQIVSDKISSDLHTLFGLQTDNRVVHAGITHTYGYLFSVLNTPYGYKRKRWIESTLSDAFLLKGESLSPETVEGTLLSNVTYFAGTLAFKNNQDRLALKVLKNVSNEIKNIDYNTLASIHLPIHLEEELDRFTLRTTLVHLPFKQQTEENDYLLIYTIFDRQQEKEVLITAFPIKKDAFEKIISPETMGPHRPISIRYNAYLKGFMDQKLTGRRELVKDVR